MHRPRRKRAGRGGGTGDKNPDRGPSRSDSLGFPLSPGPGPELDRPAVTLSGSRKRLSWARLQRARAELGRPRPGRGSSQRPRHQRQHCGNGAAARGPREDGRKGGAAPCRSAPPDPRPPPPFAPPARPGPPQPAGGLTCVADDDVLEEIGVRHGRGRSVPGSRLLLPLCASSAPSPAPLGREPGPRPPSAAVRASSKDPRGKRDELTAPSADRSGPALRNNNSRGASAPPPRRPGSAAGAAGGEGRIRGRARRSEPRLPRGPVPQAGRSRGDRSRLGFRRRLG